MSASSKPPIDPFKALGISAHVPGSIYSNGDIVYSPKTKRIYRRVDHGMIQMHRFTVLGTTTGWLDAFKMYNQSFLNFAGIYQPYGYDLNYETGTGYISAPNSGWGGGCTFETAMMAPDAGPPHTDNYNWMRLKLGAAGFVDDPV